MIKTLFFALLGLYVGADFTYRNLPPKIITISEQVIVHDKPRVKIMTVTAYSLHKKECNKDLKHTATMKKPVPGLTAAVSRDNMHLLGQKIYIKGKGVWLVTDIMNARFKNRIDLLMSKKDAKEFGKQVATVAMVN